MPKIPGEHRPAKIRKPIEKLLKVPAAVEKPPTPPKQRACCATPAGAGPHGPECKHLRENRPKKMRRLDRMDAKQRWPDGTNIEGVWTGEIWNIKIKPAGVAKGHIFQQGTGFHSTIGRMFREWKKERDAVAVDSSIG